MGKRQGRRGRHDHPHARHNNRLRTNNCTTIHPAIETGKPHENHHHDPMKKTVPKSEPISLLSAFLSNEDNRSNLSSQDKRLFMVGSDFRNGLEPSPQNPRHVDEDHVVMDEPPSTLQSQMAVPTLPLRALSTDIHPLSSRPSDLPTWSVSDGSLSKEYDNDTWRMYDRIQASRLQSQQKLYTFVSEAVDQMHHVVEDENHGSHQESTRSGLPGAAEEDLYDDDIFDLDM